MTVLETLAALKGIEIVFRAVRYTYKSGQKVFLDYFEKPGERAELFGQMFFKKGDFYFHPSTYWRPAEGQSAPARQGAYPHDLNAIRAFIPFFEEKARYQESLFFTADLHSSSRLVCSGSPKANSYVRLYLPSLVHTKNGTSQQFPTLLKATSLKYMFGEDMISPRVQVVSMMERGESRMKTRKMIWKWRGKNDLEPWTPKGYSTGTDLKKDFLLILRLPRTGGGGDILALSGAHGAGTESVRLLLHQLHIRELRRLADALKGAHYFQFVVEVTSVKHDQAGTIPKEIRISEECPPVILDISANDLRKTAIRDRKIW